MIRHRASATAAALVLLLGAGVRAEDGDAAPTVLLENARVLPASGPEIPRGAVLIRGGKIAAVGAAVEAPAGAHRVDLTGRTVCPGFVDAAARTGLAPSDRAGGPRDPEVEVADAADLRDPALAAARAFGVTSLVLSPGAPRGAFAGRLALLKTAAPAPDFARIADRRGPLKAVLSPSEGASSLDRASAAAGLRAAFRGAQEYADAREKYRRDLRDFLEEAAKYAAEGDALEETLLPAAVLDRLRRLDPEPREAARKALRARLALKDPEKPPRSPKRPQEPKEDPSKELLLAACRGEVPVRFEAHAVEDLRAALALAAEFHLKASIEGAREGGRVAVEIAKAKVPVVCWPATGPGAEPDGAPASAVPALIAAEGTKTAISATGGGPLAERHLPLLAALAVGHRLDREAALRAVTLDAARAAGFEARIGSLEPGKDADLLVLDGDPLAPATRVLAVWVDGVEYAGEGASR